MKNFEATWAALVAIGALIIAATTIKCAVAWINDDAAPMLRYAAVVVVALLIRDLWCMWRARAGRS